MEDVRMIDAIPKVSYITYVYSSGSDNKYRAVFLKSPESDLEVVPFSSNIMMTKGSFDDAMTFMRHGAGYRNVDVQSVLYKGKTIGYLLTQPRYVLGKEEIEPELYERAGKIYFSVSERFYDD
jgi:hypothetical protein